MSPKTKITKASGPRRQVELINVPRESKLGFMSLSVFLISGGLEFLFFVSAMIVVASVPAGSTETFPFSRNIGLLILVGQVVHLAGFTCGAIGLLWDKDRTLAYIGLMVNSIIPIIFFLL